MLGEVVSQVEFSFLPLDVELALFDSVLYPVEAHVHCFGPLEFHASIGKAIGGGVIGCYVCGVGLWSAHFAEDLGYVS